MCTSDHRHPSRDALLRDALGQIKEQRGVSVERFARTLNSLTHAMCPAKTADMPCLASFTDASVEYDQAVMSWIKRVQRWASSNVEIPAWLEEPWVTALEELGDTETRIALVRRHGCLGVPIPQNGVNHTCVTTAIGSLSREHGEAMVAISRLIEMSDLSDIPAEMRDSVRDELEDVIAAATGAIAMLDSKPALKAVGR